MNNHYRLTNKKNVQYVMAALKQMAIRQVVLSPGSRNAPMLISFPQDKDFELYSIVDERSAAFFALGLALQSRQAVVLNCTSGSALLNYAPAVAEAYYQQIPLVVLSADRPENLIDRGYGQCIRQPKALDSVVKASLHLPETAFDTPQTAKDNIRQLQNVLQTAVSGVPGPVHINLPLAEPLYDTEKVTYTMLPPLAALQGYKTNILPANFLKDWNATNRKLILVGQWNEDTPALGSVLALLAQRDDVFVLSETLSNLGNAFATNIDPLLANIQQAEEKFQPELVLSIGGQLVSKRIKKWLSDLSFTHWQITDKQYKRDTFFNEVQTIDMDTVACLQTLAAEKPALSDVQYAKDWRKIQTQVAEKHQSFKAAIPFSDFQAYASISQYIRQHNIDCDLHFANSTAIRYAQLFAWQQADNGLKMYSNRGVSGLEGSISTALGFSQHTHRLTCIITGDLAFFYDANALWNRYLKPNFRIILINNQGGGIFRFIDGPLQSGQLDYFETPHQRHAASIAKEAGMTYWRCNNAVDLQAALPKVFAKNAGACLLEVQTPPQDNDKVLKAYFEHIHCV